MESYLNENFGGVKCKNTSEESLDKWRKLCGVVKNPTRRFRFTANLSKRGEAAAMRRTNQVYVFYTHSFKLRYIGRNIVVAVIAATASH
ncbi:putative calcium-transporting ATPase [Lupinus albus]|uniref:Putative calcium-transporting ATPase n=1 Tax=Lupinus albus TaxID=3870 RepID=A0A6A4QIJ0_LUPAL|nr:putative calcium-transporting ATPase [Lupinus albus]